MRSMKHIYIYISKYITQIFNLMRKSNSHDSVHEKQTVPMALLGESANTIEVDFNFSHPKWTTIPKLAVH